VKRSPITRSPMPPRKTPMAKKPARNSGERAKFRKGVRARSGGRCEYVWLDGSRCDCRAVVAHHIYPVGSHPHLVGCVDDGADLCEAHDDMAHKNDVKFTRERLLATMPPTQRERLESARRKGK